MIITSALPCSYAKKCLSFTTTLKIQTVTHNKGSKSISTIQGKMKVAPTYFSQGPPL